MHPLKLAYCSAALKQWRKYRIDLSEVSQNNSGGPPDGSKHVAFEEYKHKLVEGSQLPRGHIFEGAEGLHPSGSRHA
jgi:hypothetical protein